MKTAIIVDDNESWLNRIGRLLTKLDFNVITYIKISEKLKLFLKDSEYDLLITDIRLDNLNLHKEEGIELVRIVKDKNSSIPIILISGNNEDANFVRNTFVELEIDDFLAKKNWSNEIFNNSVERAIKKIAFRNKLSVIKEPQDMGKRKIYSVGIITALYTSEFEHIKEIVGDIKSINDPEFDIQTGKIKGTEKNIVISHQHNMGMIDASFLTAKIIKEYQPEYIIMTGVCGGRKSKGLKIGDVIIPKKVLSYQSGKIEEDGFKYYLSAETITGKHIQLAENHQREICSKIEISSGRNGYGLKAHFQSMACGSMVVNKRGYLDSEIAKFDEQVIGVDMESYGFIRAWKLMNNGFTKPLIVKSVMDFTEDKTDKDKDFAAYTSAQFLKFLIQDVLFNKP